MVKKFGISVLAMIAASPCFATEESELISSTGAMTDGKTVIRVGGFYSNSNSTMDVTDPVLGEDFKIDFEQDLNLEESQFLPFFEIFHHFNDKHLIFIDWKQLHRSAEVQSLSKPFQVDLDDKIFDVKVGSQLKTTLNIDIARIGYGYNFYQGNNFNLGVSLGLHAMFVKTGFEGTVGACVEGENIDGCEIAPIPNVVDEKITAPLPDIGLYGTYEFSPGFSFKAHAQYFQIKLDDLDGRLIDVRAGIEAEISKNWHMTAAFNYYEVDVDYEQKSNFEGVNIANYNLSYSFIGPMLSVSYHF